MNDSFMKHVLLVLVMLVVSLYSYAQRDYWNDRRRYGNQRQQVVRNMKNWEQQEREKRKEASYLRNYQQRRGVQQRESISEENRSNNNNSIEGNDKNVTLVTKGTGNTKEEATRNALRSAIEQAYGTFVSANTEVLNDELIKDDIVTVTSGNIKSFKELSVDQSNELYDVTVQANISIDQLTQFAKSRGMQAELAGASFIINMKMRELNKRNEATAIKHMVEKLEAIAKKGLFDYELQIGEPRLTEDSKYALSVTILFCENDNTRAFYNTIYNTIEALSLTNKEIKEYQKVNLDYYVYNQQLTQRGKFDRVSNNDRNYVMRNNYRNVHFNGIDYTWLMPLYKNALLNYVIKDNLGNVFAGKNINSPVRDAKFFSFFWFNPTIEYPKYDNKTDSYVVVRGNKHIYYVQRFDINYSEYDLSRVTSITIENKNE